MRRPRYTGQAAVNEAVYRLMNKFEYPDELGGGGPIVPSGGGGAPTVVVAASDASDLSKGKADYVCTGVNDHEVIQAAIKVMPGFGVGGRVLLTEGTFECAYGQISADVFQAVTIQGMGQNSTRVRFDGTSGDGFDISSGSDTICDLRIQDTGSGTGAGVRLHSSAGGRIDNVLFDNSGVGIEIANVSSAAREVFVGRCAFRTGGIGIDATPSSAGRGLIVVGNHFENPGTSALAVSNSEGVMIVGNFINIFSGSGIDGVVLTGIDAGIVSSNVISTNTGDGVVLVNSDDCKVSDNWIDASGSNISIEGTSSSNFVTTNTLRPGGNIGVAIVDATCLCNIVVGNDLGAASDYTTDAISDNGADTHLFWPADPTYGDNFTGCYGS